MAKIDPYLGFDEWWSSIPNHKRKTGKINCQMIWLTKKLWLWKDMIIAAQQDDVKRANKGEYSDPRDPAAKYKFYPAPERWLKQGRWQRDDWHYGPLQRPQCTKPPEPPRLSPDAARAALEAGMAKAGYVRGRLGGFVKRE